MTTEPIALRDTSGDPAIDGLLRDLLDQIELGLPGRLRGAYLEGSYADRSATPLSDLDVSFVFGGQLAADERQRLDELRTSCKQRAPLSLDLVWLSEHELARLASPDVWSEPLLIIYSTSLRHSSRLIAGDDLRATIPNVPLTAYTRAHMHFPYQVLAGQRGHPARLIVPLDGPDPADEFLGYTGRRLRGQPSTKRLVHATGFIATALLALLAGRIVGNKRDAVAEYRRWIGDEWAELLEDVQRFCRGAWGYAAPADPADQQMLRTLCRRGLAFENVFMAHYKRYLLDELRQPDPAIQVFALERLSRIIYPDPAIVAAIDALTTHPAADLRATAGAALRSYQPV